MTRHQQTIRMVPPPTDVQDVYRRRGMTPPVLSGPYPEAATWPYNPRAAHRVYARMHGYYWMPCVLCERPHGGHEISDTIPDPIGGENRYMAICPVCTVERNGGQL